MCFSASASFTASGVLLGMGIFTVKAARTPELRLFGSTPLFFAIQQFLEGVVWVTLTHDQTHTIAHTLAVYGFLFFAGVFWPVWIPALLYRLEEKALRKKIIKGFLLLGSLISVVYLVILLRIGSDVEVISNHISYPFPTNQFEHYATLYGLTIYHTLAILYLIVMFGSCFTSSFPRIWIFSLLSAISVIVTGIFYVEAFGSVWCFFEAVISTVIYYVVKQPAIKAV